MPLAEVRLMTAEGNYVRLSWGDQKPLLGRALASLDVDLEGEQAEPELRLPGAQPRQQLPHVHCGMPRAGVLPKVIGGADAR